MSEPVTFFVPGVPQPGGSKKGFPVRTKTGGTRIAIVEDAKHNAPWRAVVTLAARDMFPDGPLTGPLEVTFEFRMPRPKGHYGSGRNAGKLKPGAPEWHTGKPDTTKLIRSTEDALTGIAWADDAQVSRQSAAKMYTSRLGQPGCFITITHLDYPALFEERS